MLVERLDPGSLIEVDDLLMKGRKIGLVDDTGVGYFDIHADGELPKPLHTNLNPRSLGQIVDWMPEDIASREAFVLAWEGLSNRGLDLLTIARALRWGLANGAYDVDTLEKMGRAATDSVLAGRQALRATVAASN